MAKVPTVYLAVRADTGEVKKKMSEAQKAFLGFQKTVKKTGKSSKGFTASMQGMATKAVGVVALGAALYKLGKAVITATAEYEILEARLKTATGSVDKAQVKLKELTVIASKLPLSIQEATSSFVQLKNLGLDATERSLVSFTNTASAMGKNLNQFVEAVADASTREFERLKEFGIKAKNEGDKIRFIFQGNEKVVENTTDNIVEYLTRLGEVEFAGAAGDQMDTIVGSTSNFKDALWTLNVELGKFIEASAATKTTLDTMAGVFESAKNSLAGANAIRSLNADFVELRSTMKDGVDDMSVWNALLGSTTEADRSGMEALADRSADKMIQFKDATEESSVAILKYQTDLWNMLQDHLRALDERNTLEKEGADLADAKAKSDKDAKAQELSKARAVNFMEKTRIDDLIKNSKARDILSAEIPKLQAKADELFKKILSAQTNQVSEGDFKQTVSDYNETVAVLEKVEGAIEDVDSATTAAQERMKDFTDDIKRGLADAIIEGENFKGTLKSILKEMAKSSLMDLFGGFGKDGKAGTGILGGIGKAFGGGLATGGPVSANTSYMVGEKGPELFTPSGAGAITPNHRVGGGSTDVSVVNNFAINGDDKQEIQQMIASSVSMSVNLAVSKISDNKRRRA